MTILTLRPGHTDLAFWRALRDGASLELDTAAWPNITRGHMLLAKAARGNDALYGVNTGFGKLASIRIPTEKLAELQVNIVRSHCAGVGKPLPDRVVRMVLALKLASLSHGASVCSRRSSPCWSICWPRAFCP